MSSFFDGEEEPSLLVSLIPFIGSGQEALYHFKHGNTKSCVLWGLMAVSDIFLIKAVFVSGAKLTGKMAASVIAKNSENIATKGTTEVIGHLTNAAAEQAIKNEGKIGARWGVFGLEASKIPASPAMRFVKTLVRGDLSKVVTITGDATRAFSKPPLFGVFSGLRRMGGIRSTALGSIDLVAGKFIPGEIFRDNIFRSATYGEKLLFEGHQFILDYAVDGFIYAGGKGLLFSDDMSNGLYKNPRLK